MTAISIGEITRSEGLDPKGQVPMALRTPNYLLIGSGRLATHFQFYLSVHGLPVQQWTRHCSDALEPLIAKADVILLAISDNALSEWAIKADLAGKTLVHFSGACHFPNAWGFHPLMTFTADLLYPADFYPTIPFVADKGFPVKEIFPTLQNPIFEIEPEKKPLYHALCHMAANFPALLWVQLFQPFERNLGLSHEILKPMLGKILSNTFEQREQALAGPHRRGDWQTLEMHDQALDSFPHLQCIYDHWTKWATKELT
jgi:predicted short-subunit dehydrogenase-like oxidoreductase (DUF2520 family)